MTCDFRLGRWEDVLADVTCDALIVDAPYSSRTHDGHDRGSRSANRPIKANGVRDTGRTRREIDYASWTPEEVAAFVRSWSPRCRGWMVSITDDVLAPAWADAMRTSGRYVFAPLPLVETGSRVRLTGDGPSSWTCWIIVGRPRTPELARWGTLPGAYIGPAERKLVVGGKPLGIVRAIIRDYSRTGDLIVDPCAGGATTLVAALAEGRRAVGAEIDPLTYRKALARLEKARAA